MEEWAERKGQDRLLLECEGITVGGRTLPPLRLHAGEALCLHVEPARNPWWNGLLLALKGGVPHHGLHFFGSVAYLERPMPRRRWFGLLKNPSALKWLVRERGLSPAQAAEVLGRVDVQPGWKVGSIGWNERTLLALEACFYKPPDILVFDTAGQDPMGASRLLGRVDARPQHLALIYLKTRNDPSEPCVRGSICLEAVASPPKSAVVE